MASLLLCERYPVAAAPQRRAVEGGDEPGRERIKNAVPFPLKTGPLGPTVFTRNYTPLGRFNALFSGFA
jgi:hypothetical protein